VRLFVTLSAEALDPAHPAHGWILNHYDSPTTWLTAAVQFGREQREFRPDTPVDPLVRLAIATMDGLQQQWLATGEGFDMAEAFRRWKDVPELSAVRLLVR
jgi:hypothetical protein